jgi:hypothetical protein
VSGILPDSGDTGMLFGKFGDAFLAVFAAVLAARLLPFQTGPCFSS